MTNESHCKLASCRWAGRARWVLFAALGSGCYQGIEVSADADGTDSSGGPADSDAAGGSGETTDGDDGGDTPGGIPACDSSLVPDEVALRRLTRIQYQNSVRDLVTWASPTVAAATHEALGPVLAQLPQDVRQPAEGQHLGGFRSMDQAVQQQHIDAGYRIGRAVGAALTDSDARLEEVVGSCATDSDPANDDACVDEFVRRFGERALRRPLTEEEVETYRAVYDAEGLTQGIDPDAFTDVIAALMIAPQFMYLVEHGEEAVSGLDGVYRLSSWEVASRLSYHFWQTAPDDALRQAAADGSLLDDEGYAEQVERMFADPRARAAVQSFYREWLWLDDVVAVGTLLGTPTYDAFVGETQVDERTHENMIQEVLDMATYYTFDADGSLEDLLLSDRSFAATPDLAAIYDVEPWEGGEPPVFPQVERAGVLGRAALLSNRTHATRPIHKGVLVRTALLCDPLPPPPPNAATTVPDFSGDKTRREIVEELTEQPDSSCSVCHATLINPLGFVSEEFDALGRFRPEQDIFDGEGNVVATRRMDSTVSPGIDLDGESPTISNPRELGQLLVDSGRVQTCFARMYLRFTFARDENDDQDACVLGDLVERIDDGAPLSEVLRAIALRPEFRQRSFN